MLSRKYSLNNRYCVFGSVARKMCLEPDLAGGEKKRLKSFLYYFHQLSSASGLRWPFFLGSGLFRFFHGDDVRKKFVDGLFHVILAFVEG
jgi:hypothetical protein